MMRYCQDAVINTGLFKNEFVSRQERMVNKNKNASNEQKAQVRAFCKGWIRDMLWPAKLVRPRPNGIIEYGLTPH